MSKKGFFATIIALPVLIVGSAWAFQVLSPHVAPELPPAASVSVSASSSREAESHPAPDITVYDEAGQTVTLSSLRGKPVILNFWASWCPPCQRELPHFNEAYGQYGDRITFAVVDLTDGARETQESALAHLRENDYSLPPLFDLDGTAAYTYSVSSIPATFFIDAEGELVTYAVGALNREMLQQGIELLLGE